MNRPLTGASVQIDFKPPQLKQEEIALLKSKIEDTYNITVRSVESGHEPVSRTIAAAPTTHALSQTTELQTGREREPSRIIPHTIRSGQIEEFPQGSLIIYGDVNSGGEARAGGDIIILGTLRGSAYAGINGRLSSVIIALDFAPIQLQIGTCVNRPLTTEKPRGYPEIARIGAEDLITVEKFVKF